MAIKYTDLKITIKTENPDSEGLDFLVTGLYYPEEPSHGGYPPYPPEFLLASLTCPTCPELAKHFHLISEGIRQHTIRHLTTLEKESQNGAA